MPFSRKAIEGEISAKMAKGKTRKQAIDELKKAAESGAAKAEAAGLAARDSLLATEARVAKLKSTISSSGRLASLENSRVAILRQIIQDDKNS